MARVLLLANNDIGLYKFRKELIERLLNEDYDVYLSLPCGGYIKELVKMGCKFIETPIDRRGTNPLRDFNLLMKYVKILQKVRPDAVFTYTIKPNIYGGLACKMLGVSYISNVTGLGTSIENPGIVQKIVLHLYKLGLKKASCVFFQNQSNRDFFRNKYIVNGNTRLIPGSGVNLNYHCLEEYPQNDDIIKFLFIGRIMKDKGIDELLESAVRIKRDYPNVQFHIIGECEEHYQEQLEELEKQGIIKYHGKQNDVHSFIIDSHATILPSYHEGTANVLLESASSGRPVLASEVTGCRETFDEGISGFGFKVKDVDSLLETIVKFINLPNEQKKAMGLAGRKKVEREFDRQIVINSYIEETNMIIKNKN